ncbi:hypothetical protein GLOIN_2v1660148 [Rhizophagus irregularis DAOM 181602=DAOM 197198]|uniref:Uncharacterized protein n=1 Tax=Rhizophagus irregularis (strain DAOM 181602 / DAOM 197198 / MUCL 43194) TaxID=747089 RepID=A0A2P4PL40_RHIID|nr:hypothetical protein GLOIN_2v1660148 [Rhizophagus irregularis DAOM 181602=DAOM 197198]POG66080.1 hypothetical protein GLOIN_2v1660148 [Rhizophagus irregularis DAOM 181602=DAOM 197198]|eukprot:XP_025172946.1 hypothetical protein GLOIN_2v1660148 [Rhizophagus irregularis DAOM 181602=DAOM 197198]
MIGRENERRKFLTKKNDYFKKIEAKTWGNQITKKKFFFFRPNVSIMSNKRRSFPNYF